MVVTKPNGVRYFEERIATSIYDTLSTEAKILGLSVFWKEASYNFVFFDRLKLNWDSAYYAFLPKVIAAKNVYEYWKVLDTFARLLKDGHTNTYTPDYFWKDIGRPPVNWTKVGNRTFVTRIDERLIAEIPLGTGVVAVDGLLLEDLTKHGKYVSGIKGTEVTFTFRSKEGNEFKKTIARVAGKDRSITYVPASVRRSAWRDFETKELEDGIAYVKINTFEDDTIPIKFRAEIPKINKSKALIVDIRENGGGNTAYAIGVAQHLTDKSYMIGSAWKTRLHKSANKAWASVGESDWAKKNFNYLIGNEWEIHEGQQIKIDKKTERVKVPIIILMGENTFSAAEDFLILLDGSKNITLVGQPSAGSSGQPLFISLPGGFEARICAKRDTYPDGRDFIGTGVHPHVLVAKSVEDYFSGVDTELREAIRILKNNGRVSR